MGSVIRQVEELPLAPNCATKQTAMGIPKGVRFLAHFGGISSPQFANSTVCNPVVSDVIFFLKYCEEVSIILGEINYLFFSIWLIIYTPILYWY